MKLGFDVQWSAYSRLVLQWSRCVLKSPWLCRLGDASYVMCTALYMMVLYDRARVSPTTKTSDEISIICLFRLILQANTLFYFVLWYSSYFEFICSFHIFFKWLLNLWKCDDLLRNSFVHLRSNVYCEDYMLQFLSVDSTCLFVYQDANGCHPLQDGSANASESGSQ